MSPILPPGPGRAVHRRARIGADRGTLGQVRITVRVRPGSAHPGVGGQYGGALVVRVSARATGGQATAAALAAVAAAFGVSRRDVTLVTGAASRTKVLEVAGGDPALLARLLAQ
jgi:uncharacterized protein